MGADTDLQIFADYFQVYLSDPKADVDWSDAWKAPSALADRFIACERILGFATERNTTVPLRVVLHDVAPALTHQVARADHAVKAGLFTTDRRLVVAGCSDYWPEAYSIPVLPGFYGAAFLSFGLASVNGVQGKDRYELHIWPVGETPKPEVLVRWQPK
ncbi:hypothetical protein [Bradyrhizobium yuanmingense]|uniref:hypothetical protein n=1 Tax=Bradyrhizobium yuanmingense TaxID=108015 RepID=UPI0023B945D1|nr:hypothetical protein [Bradyrhizobium yuanmingense]MDF0580368.1 hypothetical protein [Bradyrhizobium yuanmingense]